MNKHQQSGMTTLLITSMLLIVALLFSLASYKNLFYQIKRTQNEVLARQAHWVAEGGLECGFVELKHEKIKPTESAFSQQCIELALFPVSALTIIPDPPIGDHSKYVLKSSYTHAGVKQSVKKVIEYGGGGVVSTLQTSASIQLTGSQHFVPNKTQDKTSDGRYKCKSVISGGTVNYIASVGTDEHFLTIDATSRHGGVLGIPSFECNSAYLSNLYEVGKEPTGFAGILPIKGSDILENETVDVFKDIFGKDISEYASVREEIKTDAVGVVFGEHSSDRTSGGWVKNCHTKIKKEYDNGKRRFWINGNCALEGSIFGIAQDMNNTVQLIVFDGVLFIKAMSDFNGLIYLYTNPLLNVQTIWEDLFYKYSEIGVIPGSFQKHDIVTSGYSNIPFLLEGSTRIDGGIGIDAINRVIKIYGSVIPSYNEDKVTKYSTQMKWQQGSWHDF
ncbi:hypothetical protein [Photobacterium phosphoreum]|uniref:hypothetical protein n=1 Tax=Photobacterium phosphoreum TaxID=659 RepID=UPI001E60B0C1|nr:hypothetical protein [Photobacterium phosphoreum]MCD9510435.1 hypothetical protein [Photobacterium phosphoreum]